MTKLTHTEYEAAKDDLIRHLRFRFGRGPCPEKCEEMEAKERFHAITDFYIHQVMDLYPEIKDQKTLVAHLDIVFERENGFRHLGVGLAMDESLQLAPESPVGTSEK